MDKGMRTILWLPLWLKSYRASVYNVRESIMIVVQLLSVHLGDGRREKGTILLIGFLPR